jgi:ketosteroid isomerase-like protein
MRTRSTVVGLALVVGLAGLVACGGAEPPPPPLPPPPPPADTTPATSAAPADPTPPAPPPKPAMSDLQQTAIKAMLAAFAAHDPKAVAALYTTDAVLKSPPDPDVTGRDGVAGLWAANFAAIPDSQIGFSRGLLKGNVAVVTWAWSGTDSGTGLGGKPTKRPIGGEGASVLWFSDDGLVKEQHGYADAGALKAQLDPKAKAGSFRPVPSIPTSTQTVVSTGGPDEDALLATGNKLYTAFDSHKPGDILAFISDDTTETDFASATPTKGIKAWKAQIAAGSKAFPDAHQTPLSNQWAIGNYLVSESVAQGTQKGPFMGLPATKKPVSLHNLDIVTFNGGKIATFETYWNSVELKQELGLIKPAGDAGAAKK